ncbi:proline-rich receptor-like protein kinase PERK2 [Iris pallida]|uniref:Proline-rich receptor-like protein kinase PERK2 n=1 Tax=Iris pallida TaxID=29817 RepID=A0AAX6FML7_IRIPA|nr:proline-rich receptor-like protein kinase PERK2 [Iris pallida]
MCHRSAARRWSGPGSRPGSAGRCSVSRRAPVRQLNRRHDNPDGEAVTGCRGSGGSAVVEMEPSVVQIWSSRWRSVTPWEKTHAGDGSSGG